MTRWRTALPVVWSLVLAVLVLGPALGPGYVLSYDMVWVPDLALRPDVVGLGSSLPRAVPSDAVVAVLDSLVGGALLQKAVLVGCLVGGGLGAARLVPRESLVAALVAVTLYEWNPFVAERLLIGHWPVLVGYAVLPWLVDAARRWRSGSPRMPLSLWWLVPLGCLSAGAGLVTAVALLAFGVRREARHVLALLALLVAGNAPWLVTGLLHAGDATTDPAGARLFALRAEGSLPAPLAALGLGGIWNSEVVPPSRTGVLAWVALLVLGALAAAGVRSWLAATERRDRLGFVVCWSIGWLVAVATWLVPGAAGWLYAHLPGAGVARDGARILALCAPLGVVLAAHGAADLVRRLPRANRVPIGVALVVVPIALLPDLAFGVAGQLRATTYPAGYAQARTAVAAAVQRGADGDLLVLPLSSYRRPSWNQDHKVLDPTGRYLGPDDVSSDVLVVGSTALGGEDPRVQSAARALRAPDADARARALGRLGIRFVATDASSPRSPGVAGTDLVRTADLRVQELRVPVVVDRIGTPAAVAVGAAWAAYVGLLGTGSVLLLVLLVRGRAVRGPANPLVR